MNCAKLSFLTGVCLLTANLMRADDVNWHFDSGSTGSGPYPVDTLPADSPIQASSQLSLDLPTGVAASINSGATTPASGNYLMLNASSQAINSGTELNFTLNASGPVNINSLSYAAKVFMLNQGPDQITWSYDIDYGAGKTGTKILTTDTFMNKGNWVAYNPNFGITTVGPATISIDGAISGQDLLANNNGNVGFDSFTFDAVSITVPEPKTMTLLLFGLVFLIGRKARYALPTSPN